MKLYAVNYVREILNYAKYVGNQLVEGGSIWGEKYRDVSFPLLWNKLTILNYLPPIKDAREMQSEALWTKRDFFCLMLIPDFTSLLSLHFNLFLIVMTKRWWLLATLHIETNVISRKPKRFPSCAQVTDSYHVDSTYRDIFCCYGASQIRNFVIKWKFEHVCQLASCSWFSLT
jgi:hypothetical protein